MIGTFWWGVGRTSLLEENLDLYGARGSPYLVPKDLLTVEKKF